MWAMLMPEQALTIQQLAASYKVWFLTPFSEKVSENAGPHQLHVSPLLKLSRLHTLPLQYWLKP